MAKNNKKLVYDSAFGFHGGMVVIAVLFWTSGRIVHSFPQYNSFLLVIGELGMYVFVPLSLLAVPAVILVSLFHWRDWKLLLPGLFLFVLSAVILSTEQSGACPGALAYLCIATATSAEWFLMRRKRQKLVF